MGQRLKAEQALAALRGERPSLGERVDATVAGREPEPAGDTANPAAPAGDGPAPPSGASAGMHKMAEDLPMPPEGAGGSWVWVRLPDGGGVLCARAVAWVRVNPDELSPQGWALSTYSPFWRLITHWSGPGGQNAGAVAEYQVVPSSMATPIPGRFTGVPGGPLPPNGHGTHRAERTTLSSPNGP